GQEGAREEGAQRREEVTDRDPFTFRANRRRRVGSMFDHLKTGPGCPPLALALALVITAAAPAQQQGGLAPAGDADRPKANVGYEQKLGDKVPLDLRFVREEGADVSLGDCIGGKPTILIMAYYRCPQLCGEVFAGLLD